MRYCPFCHRWNLDRPQLCNYCGRSWYVRLCPRGHENPVDAQFCGICGSTDLTDPSGPRPWWIRLLRGALLLFLLLILVSLVQGFPRFPDLLTAHAPMLIALGFLLIAYHLGLAVLPTVLKRPFVALNKLIWGSLERLLLWLWERIKLLFS